MEGGPAGITTDEADFPLLVSPYSLWNDKPILCDISGLVLVSTPSLLSTTALVPTTDARSTEYFPLIQDSQRPRIQCSLSAPPRFHHIRKPCPCPRNPYRASTSGPHFFSVDRKKQNSQPRINSGGKTLKGDKEHLRSWKRVKSIGIRDPRN